MSHEISAVHGYVVLGRSLAKKFLTDKLVPFVNDGLYCNICQGVFCTLCRYLLLLSYCLMIRYEPIKKIEIKNMVCILLPIILMRSKPEIKR